MLSGTKTHVKGFYAGTAENSGVEPHDGRYTELLTGSFPIH